MSRWRIGLLLSWMPLKALLTWPAIRRCRGRDWIAAAPLDEGKVERVGEGT